MSFHGKRILLISPEPWDGLHMSKHHFAQGAAEAGGQVFFLDPPCAGNALRTQRRGDVTVVQYAHWFRGVNRLPAFIGRWYYQHLLRRLERACGGHFDIIWCFDTSRMQRFPETHAVRLLHLVDQNILGQGHGLMRSADLILASSAIVQRDVQRVSSVPVHIIGHALDERWTKQPTRDLPATPSDVVYAGQLNTRLHDWEGFLAIASAHPQRTFTFIGPYSLDLDEPAFRTLLTLPNVRFTGLMDKDALVDRLQAADLLLFGFRTDRHAEQCSNPHKVLEYLSTGVPMVGSWTMHYASDADLFRMAALGEPLLHAFDEVVADYASWASPGRRLKRMHYARERTMPHILNRIRALLPPTHG